MTDANPPQTCPGGKPCPKCGRKFTKAARQGAIVLLNAMEKHMQDKHGAAPR